MTVNQTNYWKKTVVFRPLQTAKRTLSPQQVKTQSSDKAVCDGCGPGCDAGCDGADNCGEVGGD